MADITDIVLFNGSLAELNLFDKKRQYKIAGTEYTSKPIREYDERDGGDLTPSFKVSSSALKEVRMDLRKKGFDGLINKRTFIGQINQRKEHDGRGYAKIHSIAFYWVIEGTPVKLPN